MSRCRQRLSPFRPVAVIAFLFSVVLLCSALPATAQDQPPPTQSPSQSAPSADTGKPKQDVPSEAGGPGNDVGPYAIPKKKADEDTAPPPPPAPKKSEDFPDYSLKVNVPLVNVDVMVTSAKDGQFIPGLKKENFRILEDGVPQNVTKFGVSEAPITAVLLVEFATTSWQFLVDALNGSYAFANSLKKDDWTAVSYYDMQPHILTDFTQDKARVFGALNQMRIPGLYETNEFDALYDTLDRLDRVEGKKYIILITSGIDTFSKITYDKILKKVKDTKDVTIFPFSIGFYIRERCEAQHCLGAAHGPAGWGSMSPATDYAQADNELRTFAELTGGRAYFPRFPAEFSEAFRDIGDDIRHQYTLAYSPTNTKLDGTYRKLKVQIVAPDGGPLKVRDQKGKDVKIAVSARDGYTAKHTVD